MKPAFINTIHKVADYIICCHRALFQENPTPMKLQKLCYYAEGLFLGRGSNQELFPEQFQAWPCGPVCPELHQRLQKYGDKAKDFGEILSPTFDAYLSDHLSCVNDAYGRYDEEELMRFICRDWPGHWPWQEARGALQENEECKIFINKKTVEEQFKMQLFFCPTYRKNL